MISRWLAALSGIRDTHIHTRFLLNVIETLPFAALSPLLPYCDTSEYRRQESM
jgi:hypothetical protein